MDAEDLFDQIVLDVNLDENKESDGLEKEGRTLSKNKRFEIDS